MSRINNTVIQVLLFIMVLKKIHTASLNCTICAWNNILYFKKGDEITNINKAYLYNYKVEATPNEKLIIRIQKSSESGYMGMAFACNLGRYYFSSNDTDLWSNNLGQEFVYFSGCGQTGLKGSLHIGFSAAAKTIAEFGLEVKITDAVPAITETDQVMLFSDEEYLIPSQFEYLFGMFPELYEFFEYCYVDTSINFGNYLLPDNARSFNETFSFFNSTFNYTFQARIKGDFTIKYYFGGTKGISGKENFLTVRVCGTWELLNENSKACEPKCEYDEYLNGTYRCSDKSQFILNRCFQNTNEEYFALLKQSVFNIDIALIVPAEW